MFRVGNAKEGASVLKIIPFGGDIDINQERQTTVEDIISEVRIFENSWNPGKFTECNLGDHFYGSIKTSRK